MQQYLKSLRKVRDEGVGTGNRTATDTIALFGEVNFDFDLSTGQIPVLTTKKIHLKSVIHELLWMLSGDSNIKYLNDNGVRIWDEWADENGDLGPVYGKQWRSWDDTRVIRDSETSPEELQAYKDRGFDVETLPVSDPVYVLNRKIDQIKQIEDALRSGGESRRMILTAWNVSYIDEMKLPPCHTISQFGTTPLTIPERHAIAVERGFTEEWINGVEPAHEVSFTEWADNIANIPKRRLSCKLYQRSADFFLGIPFNVAFYGILTRLLADTHNYAVGKIFMSIGDAHIYVNHLAQVEEQLSRETKPSPAMVLLNNTSSRTSILDINYEDIQVLNYDSWPAIKGVVAV